MSRTTCEDCGTRVYNGRCDNCHEELAIFEDQGEYMDRPFSHEFMQKVTGQLAIVEPRRRERKL